MKHIKKVANIGYWLIFIIAGALAILLFMSSSRGPTEYRAFSVDSGSMEPAISVGSVIFIKPKEVYEEGDIVTFRDERDAQRVVTHRVVSIERDDDIGKLGYQTKGDANEDPDREIVPHERVLGAVLVSVPLFGYAVSFAKTQTGFIALIIVPATLLIYSEMGSIAGEVKKMISGKKQETKDKKQDTNKQQKTKKKVKKIAKPKVTKKSKKKSKEKKKIA